MISKSMLQLSVCSSRLGLQTIVLSPQAQGRQEIQIEEGAGGPG
jgi:hypothetical protein